MQSIINFFNDLYIGSLHVDDEEHPHIEGLARYDHPTKVVYTDEDLSSIRIELDKTNNKIVIYTGGTTNDRLVITNCHKKEYLTDVITHIAEYQSDGEMVKGNFTIKRLGGHTIGYIIEPLAIEKIMSSVMRYNPQIIRQISTIYTYKYGLLVEYCHIYDNKLCGIQMSEYTGQNSLEGSDYKQINTDLCVIYKCWINGEAVNLKNAVKILSTALEPLFYQNPRNIIMDYMNMLYVK